MPDQPPARTVGQIVDGLGVKPTGIDDSDLFSDAIVIMKAIRDNGHVTLWVEDNGVDWITKLGMIRAAALSEEPQFSGPVDDED